MLLSSFTCYQLTSKKIRHTSAISCPVKNHKWTLKKTKAFVQFISINAKSNPMNGQSTSAVKIFDICHNLPCNK